MPSDIISFLMEKVDMYYKKYTKLRFQKSRQLQQKYKIHLR